MSIVTDPVKTFIEFKPKIFRGHKESHIILIDGTIYEEDTTIWAYAPQICQHPFFCAKTLWDIKPEIN